MQCTLSNDLVLVHNACGRLIVIDISASVTVTVTVTALLCRWQVSLKFPNLYEYEFTLNPIAIITVFRQLIFGRDCTQQLHKLLHSTLPYLLL